MQIMTVTMSPGRPISYCGDGESTQWEVHCACTKGGHSGPWCCTEGRTSTPYFYIYFSHQSGC